MTSHHVPSSIRRFALPLVCALLSIASALWGEQVLVEGAGQPTVGPLVAAQIAVMVAIALGTLAIITCLLAIFPGSEAPPVPDLAPEDHQPSDPDLTPDPFEPVEEPTSSEEGPGPRERSAEDVITALKHSAANQARARVAADDRAAAAEARRVEIEAQLDAFRAGTAPEMKALRAQYREEATREALRKVHDLGDASERLAQALKDAKARAEADLTEKQAALDALAEELAAAREQAAQAVQAAQSAVLAARRAGAREENRRIQIALAAINYTEVEVLDPMQREAVHRHADRITDALARLAPDAAPAFGPDLPIPPLTAPAPRQGDPDQPEPSQPGTTSRGKHAAKFRRPRRGTR